MPANDKNKEEKVKPIKASSHVVTLSQCISQGTGELNVSNGGSDLLRGSDAQRTENAVQEGRAGLQPVPPAKHLIVYSPQLRETMSRVNDGPGDSWVFLDTGTDEG